jgi:hypothetical protein
MARVDPVVKRFLHGYAVAHDTTTARLVREVLSEWVHERVESTPSKRVDYTLQRLDGLVMRLQLKVASLPESGEHGQGLGTVSVAGGLKLPSETEHADESKEAPPQPGIDAVKERESAYWNVVAMLKETYRLSENEELAKKAEARMSAMRLACNLTLVAEAVLTGYERSYVQPMVDELVKLIEDLKEQLKQANQAGQESAPTGATSEAA